MIKEHSETGTTPSVAELRSQHSSHVIEAPTCAHSPNEHELSYEGGDQSPRPPIWRPIKTPVVTIGFVDEHSFTRECVARSLSELGGGLKIIAFTACEDCLNAQENIDLILYHSHETKNHNIDKNRVTFNKLFDIAPVIILSTIDYPDVIFSAIESGARGYIPTASTTPELAIEIIRLVRAGGTFVPPSSFSLRSANRQTGSLRAATTQQFTPRQMAVLEHLKLGKANKTIAHELDMSESTVKVHIRNIMKKMNATNRTEAACRAHHFAMSEEPEMVQT